MLLLEKIIAKDDKDYKFLNYMLSDSPLVIYDTDLDKHISYKYDYFGDTHVSPQGIPLAYNKIYGCKDYVVPRFRKVDYELMSTLNMLTIEPTISAPIFKNGYADMSHTLHVDDSNIYEYILNNPNHFNYENGFLCVNCHYDYVRYYFKVIDIPKFIKLVFMKVK